MAVHVAARKAIPSLAGLVVVDVVEVWFLEINLRVLPINTLIGGIRSFLTVTILQGTALASLVHMQKILSSRMQHFSSIAKAVRNTSPSKS